MNDMYTFSDTTSDVTLSVRQRKLKCKCYVVVVVFKCAIPHIEQENC